MGAIGLISMPIGLGLAIACLFVKMPLALAVIGLMVGVAAAVAGFVALERSSHVDIIPDYMKKEGQVPSDPEVEDGDSGPGQEPSNAERQHSAAVDAALRVTD